MRDGRSGASTATATRGSDFGALSLGKRESCRMTVKHSSDRSRPPSSAPKCIQMFDASDLRLYRATQAPTERHFGTGGGPDGCEEGLEERREEGRKAFNEEAEELAKEVARRFRAASEAARPPAGFGSRQVVPPPTISEEDRKRLLLELR